MIFLTGRFYATGDGVAPNLREAAKWFLRAAGNGHATAAFNIATFYANGSGMKRDTKSAIKWFELAAKGGIGAAPIQLGRLYASGSGVERDHGRAEQWLKEAATVAIQKPRSPMRVPAAIRPGGAFAQS